MARSCPEVLEKLQSVGAEVLLPQEQWPAHRVNGTLPTAVVCPHREQQLVDVVKVCREGQAVLVAAGGAHQLDQLCATRDDRPVVVVSTRNLKQVVEYTYEDMTITLQAGMSFSELNEITSAFGQHLPVDPPNSESATIGGMVATNTSGPRRLMHGAVAGFVLGGSMVMADGALIHSGARTVKSVAGYDLHKLFVGSHGALGIVTQVTLKLKPIPEDFRIVEIRASGIEDAEHISGQLLRGQTRPSMMELFDSLAARELNRQLAPGQVLLLVGYEDATESVDWQISHLRATSRAHMQALDQEASQDLYRQIVEWPARECDYAFEVIMLGASWSRLMEYCATQRIMAIARVGSGLVYGRGQGQPTWELADQLRRYAGTSGSVRFQTLPQGCSVSRWGPMDQARKWMRAVKEKFDPHSVFPWPGFLGPAVT